MELRDWAIQILSASTLEGKLTCPDELTDFNPGTPLLWDLPTRPANMGFQKHRWKDKLPKLKELHNRDKRAICLHRFGGHELLAVEIMAYALLAFPYTSPTFRKGLAHTLKEEQDHVRLYMAAMERLGIKFGDLPMYRHFWSYVPFLTTPLKYVSLMSLTFEMANLDFAPLYRDVFAINGDEASSQLMAQIFKDEIGHVSFGYRWLKNLKESDQSNYDVWSENLPPKIETARAKGLLFLADGRRLAGIDDDWIERLQRAGHGV